MLLEFVDAMDLVVAKTWFKKDYQKLVTFESGRCRTAVDYILIQKVDRKLLRNVTVMQGESSLQQHKLLVCMLQLGECRYSKGDPSNLCQRGEADVKPMMMSILQHFMEHHQSVISVLAAVAAVMASTNSIKL